MTWHQNPGQAPYRPPEEGPPIERVFVRLRNGLEPQQSWPVNTTNWRLTGFAFDVLEWRVG